MNVMVRRGALLGGGMMVMLAGQGAAQTTTPAPAQEPVRGLESFAAPATVTPTPSPSVSVIPIPPAPRIVLPAATPTPAAPNPAATPLPVAARPAPEPRPTPAPSATPAAPVVEQPSQPTSAPTPSIEPQAADTPAPAVQTTSNESATQNQSGFLPLIAIGAVILLLAGFVLFFLRRRREEAMPGEEEAIHHTPPADPAPATPPVIATPVTAPATVPVVADEPQSRARLMLALRPLRAGLNMLSATVESEIVVANRGDVPAEGIRIDVRLLGAHAGLDADLQSVRAAPSLRPAVPPFTLAPGEERRFTTIAVLPRDAIPPLEAGGRPMFVPVVSLNLLYHTAGQPGQAAQAYAVGIERVDSAKLAPLWLDVPAKMHDHVAARPHGAEIERFG